MNKFLRKIINNNAISSEHVHFKNRGYIFDLDIIQIEKKRAEKVHIRRVNEFGYM